MRAPTTSLEPSASADADRGAEQAVGGRAVLDDLVRDALGEVRRDREADADVAGLAGPRRRPRAIATLMPMSLPSESTSAPPELPGLIAASVWMTGSDTCRSRCSDLLLRLAAVGVGQVEEEVERALLGAVALVALAAVALGVACESSGVVGAADEATSIERFSALTMPLVTVPARPSGAPMAIAVSPTLSSSESANSSGVRPEASVELDDREVVHRVGADELGVVEAAVVGRDLDRRVAGGAVEGHDVGVGEHVAVFGEDDARAGAAAAARRRPRW